LSVVSESKSLSLYIYIYNLVVYIVEPLQKSFHGVSNIHRYKYIYIIKHIRRASHLFRNASAQYILYNNDKRDRLMRFAAGADSTPIYTHYIILYALTRSTHISLCLSFFASSVSFPTGENTRARAPKLTHAHTFYMIIIIIIYESSRRI